MKYDAKSALISRMPVHGDDEFRTLSVKLFNINNPHKTEKFPEQTLEFNNVEHVEIVGLKVAYFLEGNDIVINDLKEFSIQDKKTTLLITGNQE